VSSALLVTVVAVSILSLSQVEAATITEWTIPTPDSNPRSVFVDRLGFVYFTEAVGTGHSLNPPPGFNRPILFPWNSVK